MEKSPLSSQAPLPNPFMGPSKARSLPPTFKAKTEGMGEGGMGEGEGVGALCPLPQKLFKI